MLQKETHHVLSRLLAPPREPNPDKLREAVQDKLILLTGASFGIGAALATRLQHAGARLLIAARTLPTTENSYQLDLANRGQIDYVAQHILTTHGVPEIVIHNAGKSIRRSLHHSLDRPHDFERTMNVNYLGPVRLQLALLPAMLKQRRGHLVNVSSVGVRLPTAPYWAAYQASKTAFDLWIAAAVPELKRANIHCTSVYFGLVHTRMSAPTEAYRNLPGQTADEAAQTLCRALIRKPRTIQPWWLPPARALTYALERPLEHAHAWLSGVPRTPAAPRQT
jgi:NAD(P)-dependent dehydrogenase (short-subunit alcohol dehydrogenase family)